MSSRTPEVDVDQLAAAVDGGALVVDVRERQEYAQVHVPGAMLIPMGQLAARMGELDKTSPVYVVCASGNRSQRDDRPAPRERVRRLLRRGRHPGLGLVRPRCRGRPVIPDLHDAPALPEPTDPKETSQMTHQTSDSRADLTIVPIETPTLGDRSYLVHDGEVAFVVDPQRDIDRILTLLDEHGVRLTHVFETHIHNDYVTGGLALAQRTGAQYLVNGEDDVSFLRTPVSDGQVVEVGGRMRVTALATPGHTFTHLSYAARRNRSRR